MTRIPYLTREDAREPEELAVFDRLERERRLPTPNVFRAIANAPVQLDGMLTYARALRQAAELGAGLRELVILAIGQAKGGEYIVAHHERDALAAGYSPEQVNAVMRGIGDASLFSAVEAAVLQFGQAIGQDAPVTDALWDELARHLTPRQLVQLTLTASWYCSGMITTRVLGIDVEEGYRRV